MTCVNIHDSRGNNKEVNKKWWRKNESRRDAQRI